MFGLKKFFTRLPSWLKVSFLIGGLGNVLDLWQEADARERGILLLVFAPMFLCLGGLLFSVVSFVLFVLPSFVLRVLGWGLLSALFGAGGRYCYAHMTGRARPTPEPGGAGFTDVEFTETRGTREAKAERETAGSREEILRKWYDTVRAAGKEKGSGKK